MKRVQQGIAWLFLVGGIIGFTLSALDIIAKNEPKLVLLLSWSALIYEGFNSVLLTAQRKKEKK